MRGTLKHRAQFQRVYTQGRKAVSRHLVAFSLCPDATETQLIPSLAVGVVASKKVGRAVQRNRAKRVLRAALRDLHPRLCDSQWLVLVARGSIVEDGVKSTQLQEELSSTLQRIGAFGSEGAGC